MVKIIFMEEKQMKEYSLGTKCVQGGYTPGNGEPRQIPIVQSTTFCMRQARQWVAYLT